LYRLRSPSEKSVYAAKAAVSLDPRQLASWLEVRSDDTIVMRTGRTEIGTGMSGYSPQVVAENCASGRTWFH